MSMWIGLVQIQQCGKLGDGITVIYVPLETIWIFVLCGFLLTFQACYQRVPLNCWASICSLCISRLCQKLSVVTCFLNNNLGEKTLAFWKVVLRFFFHCFHLFSLSFFLTIFREKERERREAELRAQQVKNAMTTWHLVCYLPSTDTFGEGNGSPLQYSYLENPTDRGAWRAAVHGVTESQTQLSD